MALSLDDTLHAVVRVTHEHGLPLTGATVHAGSVLVFTDAVDLRWWARWLTDALADACRHVVWETDTDVAFHLHATREDVEWTVVAGQVPVDVAAPILAAHGIAVSDQHLAVPAAAAIALADELAGGGAPGSTTSDSGVEGGGPR